MVILAQTRVGFLSGEGQKFRDLPTGEKLTQIEEAYARAAVALTRARKMCVIFGPLDMKGLIGAATVMGSLMYGTGHCWKGQDQCAPPVINPLKTVLRTRPLSNALTTVKTR